MENTDYLNVLYQGRKVGTIALYNKNLLAFQYDKQWIAEGFSISPFSLPLENKVFIPKYEPMQGIFGVFADSLPDGWGHLLVDRVMLEKHIDPTRIGKLDRLAIVGNSGMGALEYQPEYKLDNVKQNMDLDTIAKECSNVLNTDYSEDLDKLFSLGGSSGGARPKILTQIDGEEWIIKFASFADKEDIGLEEYEYSLCAKECGIEMEETRLFPSKMCSGYFGIKRFDRTPTKEKIHMVSVSGLLEVSHRIPNLDYETLMKLTLELTKEIQDVENLYKLMCFNVFAHNRDDHSKNFTYMFDEEEDRWRLSPAYDLTYSNSIGGEHATTVHGNGINPGITELIAVAKSIGMNERVAKTTALNIEECVKQKLQKFKR